VDSWGCEVADFDGDSNLDLLVVNAGPNDLFLGDGAGGFADHGLYDVGECKLTATGVVTSQVAEAACPSATSTWAAPTGNPVDHSLARCAAVGDFDGDADLDVMFGNYRVCNSKYNCITKGAPNTYYRNAPQINAGQKPSTTFDCPATTVCPYRWEQGGYDCPDACGFANGRDLVLKVSSVTAPGVCTNPASATTQGQCCQGTGQGQCSGWRPMRTAGAVNAQFKVDGGWSDPQLFFDTGATAGVPAADYERTFTVYGAALNQPTDVRLSVLGTCLPAAHAQIALVTAQTNADDAALCAGVRGVALADATTCSAILTTSITHAGTCSNSMATTAHECVGGVWTPREACAYAHARWCFHALSVDGNPVVAPEPTGAAGARDGGFTVGQRYTVMSDGPPGAAQAFPDWITTAGGVNLVNSNSNEGEVFTADKKGICDSTPGGGNDGLQGCAGVQANYGVAGRLAYCLEGSSTAPVEDTRSLLGDCDERAVHLGLASVAADRLLCASVRGQHLGTAAACAGLLRSDGTGAKACHYTPDNTLRRSRVYGDEHEDTVHQLGLDPASYSADAFKPLGNLAYLKDAFQGPLLFANDDLDTAGDDRLKGQAANAVDGAASVAQSRLVDAQLWYRNPVQDHVPIICFTLKFPMAHGALRHRELTFLNPCLSAPARGTLKIGIFNNGAARYEI
jgi:hypothetical protein